jgi:hypothetical protein
MKMNHGHLKFIIDRFEAEQAICQDMYSGEIFALKKNLLPSEAKEGDLLSAKQKGYHIEQQETKIRKQKLEERMKRLFR